MHILLQSKFQCYFKKCDSYSLIYIYMISSHCRDLSHNHTDQLLHHSIHHLPSNHSSLQHESAIVVTSHSHTRVKCHTWFWRNSNNSNVFFHFLFKNLYVAWKKTLACLFVLLDQALPDLSLWKLISFACSTG